MPVSAIVSSNSISFYFKLTYDNGVPIPKKNAAPNPHISNFARSVGSRKSPQNCIPGFSMSRYTYSNRVGPFHMRHVARDSAPGRRERCHPFLEKELLSPRGSSPYLTDQQQK